MRGRPGGTFVKYLVLQVPGWVLLALFLLLLRTRIELPAWAVAAVLVLWVVKDLVLYPFLRSAYEEDPHTGAERLIGARGVVTTPLAPRGYVRVGSELWRAEVRTPERRVPEGVLVSVCGARGLTLLVEPAASEPQG